MKKYCDDKNFKIKIHFIGSIFTYIFVLENFDFVFKKKNILDIYGNINDIYIVLENENINS